MPGFCVTDWGGTAPPSPATQNHGFVSQAGGACLLCHAANMSAVSHGRHVCCVTWQTRLLCHTAGMSSASANRHACCVPQQTCLPCHTAHMSVVSHSRHVCCDAEQTCSLCHTAKMSAVSHSRHICYVAQLNHLKVITFFRPSANSQGIIIVMCICSNCYPVIVFCLERRSIGP